MAKINSVEMFRFLSRRLGPVPCVLAFCCRRISSFWQRKRQSQLTSWYARTGSDSDGDGMTRIKPLDSPKTDWMNEQSPTESGKWERFNGCAWSIRRVRRAKMEIEETAAKWKSKREIYVCFARTIEFKIVVCVFVYDCCNLLQSYAFSVLLVLVLFSALMPIIIAFTAFNHLPCVFHSISTIARAHYSHQFGCCCFSSFVDVNVARIAEWNARKFVGSFTQPNAMCMCACDGMAKYIHHWLM